ncbi:hypothetical protein AYL99_02611 [Fonsecaea erecta]|uniref:Uncharacterized protein n=1 Tax=Fonsecaea erecta TaxID=1367422 RepID=A0A178ZUD4_9EURO|nr:hypothetical protein AYL99_02611 [Fonsecaea erecta]OAP63384.1 hypothetical protein AYL99_02611 [Fonsecaea erecta]
MAAYVWDADATFRVTDIVRHGVICLGRAVTKCNGRCSWEIDHKYGSNAAVARDLLRVMSASPPDAVTDIQLRQLASHCLCNFHQGQVRQVVPELKRYLAVAVQAYKQYCDANRQHEALLGRLSATLGLDDGEQSDETVVRRVKYLAEMAG